MTVPGDSSKSDNVYISDSESGAEMARLIDQDRLITRGMDGLLPERSNDFTGIHRVLDGAHSGSQPSLVVARHSRLVEERHNQTLQWTGPASSVPEI